MTRLEKAIEKRNRLNKPKPVPAKKPVNRAHRIAVKKETKRRQTAAWKEKELLLRAQIKELKAKLKAETKKYEQEFLLNAIFIKNRKL